MAKKTEEPAPAPPRPCGFCGPGYGREPGRCYDTGRRCPGTRRWWTRRTKDNPFGTWTCACAAAGHYLAVERAA